MKVFNIIYGILCLIMAGICLLNPFASQLIYGYVFAAFVGATGIMSIINWFIIRRATKNAGLTMVSGTAGLIIGILAVIFMVMDFTIPFFNYSVQEFAAIIVMMFLLVEGVLMLVRAFTSKTDSAPARILYGIIGLFMAAMCIYGIIYPAVVIAMFGIFLGAGFGVQGVSRILVGFLQK